MKKDVIYHVGMHDGDDTAYYLSLGYRVVAIEADPTLVQNDRRRFADEISVGRLNILDVGVAEEDGEREFWINEKKSVWNSFNKHVSAQNNSPHHSIRVRCRPFGNILREYGMLIYLKVASLSRCCSNAAGEVYLTSQASYGLVGEGVR